MEMRPFPTRNLSPLVQGFGLPVARPATVLDGGAAEVGITVQMASHFLERRSDAETLVMDGETNRYELGLAYGAGQRLRIDLVVPWIQHGRGVLDGFIEGWHDTFGMPQGGRELAPRRRLLYLYQRDGQDRLRLDRKADGPGDVLLQAGWQSPWSGNGSPVGLTLSLKLPTGNSDRLLGSGSTDLAMALQADHPPGPAPLSWGCFAGGGILAMSTGDILPDQQLNVAWFATLGLNWQLFRHLALQTQLDGHTSFFKDGGFQAVGGPSAQFILGGMVDLTRAIALDLAVSEDLVVGTAPDVVFLLNLRRRY